MLILYRVDNIGLMPYRRRIVSVIGKPIHVKQNDKPGLEEVREVQERYIKELTWSAFSISYVGISWDTDAYR